MLELHVSEMAYPSIISVGIGQEIPQLLKKNWLPVQWYELCFLWKPSPELELAGMELQPQASSHSHLPFLFLTVGEK